MHEIQFANIDGFRCYRCIRIAKWDYCHFLFFVFKSPNRYWDNWSLCMNMQLEAWQMVFVPATESLCSHNIDLNYYRRSFPVDFEEYYYWYKIRQKKQSRVISVNRNCLHKIQINNIRVESLVFILNPRQERKRKADRQRLKAWWIEKMQRFSRTYDIRTHSKSSTLRDSYACLLMLPQGRLWVWWLRK